jgi:hypothetical protein
MPQLTGNMLTRCHCCPFCAHLFPSYTGSQELKSTFIGWARRFFTITLLHHLCLLLHRRHVKKQKDCTPGCQWLMPRILATWEAEFSMITIPGQPNHFLRPHLQNSHSKIDWKCGSSNKKLTLQVWIPKFKPQCTPSPPEKVRHNSKDLIKWEESLRTQMLILLTSEFGKYIFWQYRGINSEPQACEAGAPPLESHLQLFWL